MTHRKKRHFLLHPALWAAFAAAAGLALAAWWYGLGAQDREPRFHSVLLLINEEPRRMLDGESLRLHPQDRLKILEISTNITLNRNVRLVAENLDVNALLDDQVPLVSLLPNRDMFEHYQFKIHVKHRNRNIGSLTWHVEPRLADWLDKADRTIKLERRVQILEEALGYHPENAELERRLLDAYRALKRWPRVAQMLEKRSRSRPDRKTLEALLQAYEALKDQKGTVTVLRRLISLDPQDASWHSRLAETLEAMGLKSEAIEAYEDLLEWIEPEDRLPVYKRLGFLCMETGRLLQAIFYYLEAAKLDQKDANLYYNLAYLYERTGQKEKADFYLANAVTLRGEDTAGRLKLAQSHLEKGQLQKSETYLADILDKEPQSLPALLLLVQIRERQGRKADAVALYRRILALDPANETVLYNLAALEYETLDLEQSRRHFERYAAAHPEDKAVLAILFDIYRRLEMEDRAYETGRRLADLAPEEMGVYPFLFEVLDRKGAYREMAEVMEKAVAAHPDETALREYLLVAYLKLEDELKAIEQMKAIVKVKPREWKLWLSLARLLEKHGRLKEALHAYKQVLEIRPSHQEAGEAYLRLTEAVLRLRLQKDTGDDGGR